MKLPQCEIIFTPEFSKSEILFVSGGRKPEKNYFLQLAEDRKIFCVDKGIDICREENILPQFLIGDFDSAFKESVHWAIEKKIPIEIHPADKDFTDLQLALEFAEKNYKKNSAIITGVFGGRADHLFSTIFTCANSNLKICLADEREIIFFLKDNSAAEINFFEKPFAVSLLPISEICDGVTIDNVHWTLDKAKLFQKIPNAVSNRIKNENEKIKISVRKGTLAVYLNFEN